MKLSWKEFKGIAENEGFSTVRGNTHVTNTIANTRVVNGNVVCISGQFGEIYIEEDNVDFISVDSFKNLQVKFKKGNAYILEIDSSRSEVLETRRILLESRSNHFTRNEEFPVKKMDSFSNINNNTKSSLNKITFKDSRDFVLSYYTDVSPSRLEELYMGWLDQVSSGFLKVSFKDHVMSKEPSSLFVAEEDVEVTEFNVETMAIKKSFDFISDLFWDKK